MLNIIRIYDNKYNYNNENIVIIDIDKSIRCYKSFFVPFNYNILSFESFPYNNYI